MVSVESAGIIIGGIVSGVVAGWILIFSKYLTSFYKWLGLPDKHSILMEVATGAVFVLLAISYIIFLID